MPSVEVNLTWKQFEDLERLVKIARVLYEFDAAMKGFKVGGIPDTGVTVDPKGVTLRVQDK